MTSLTFNVVGTPKPQGSKRAFVANGRAIVKEDAGGAHAVWRNQVADAARHHADQLDAAPLDGPLTAVIEFRFPMPTSRPKRVRAQGTVAKITAPDIDKLVRSIFDGLQAAALITDDSRIHTVTATKVETTGWTGATITLTWGADR